MKKLVYCLAIIIFIIQASVDVFFHIISDSIAQKLFGESVETQLTFDGKEKLYVTALVEHAQAWNSYSEITINSNILIAGLLITGLFIHIVQKRKHSEIGEDGSSARPGKNTGNQ